MSFTLFPSPDLAELHLPAATVDHNSGQTSPPLPTIPCSMAMAYGAKAEVYQSGRHAAERKGYNGLCCTLPQQRRHNPPNECLSGLSVRVHPPFQAVATGCSSQHQVKRMEA